MNGLSTFEQFFRISPPRCVDGVIQVQVQDQEEARPMASRVRNGHLRQRPWTSISTGEWWESKSRSLVCFSLIRWSTGIVVRASVSSHHRRTASPPKEPGLRRKPESRSLFFFNVFFFFSVACYWACFRFRSVVMCVRLCLYTYKHTPAIFRLMQENTSKFI